MVTCADFLARARPDSPHELIRGTIVEKAAPTAEHARAQSKIGQHLGDPFDRKPGGHRPGGWWFFTELDVRFGSDVLRPDVCGFRRDRHASPPSGPVVTMVPDWVCEILSPSTESLDRVEKLQAYFLAEVGHYWLINPAHGSLESFRRTDLAYALVQSAHTDGRERFDSRHRPSGPTLTASVETSVSSRRAN